MKIESWIDVPTDSDFTIYNIPFGVCTFLSYDATKNYYESVPTCVTIIGETVIDLSILEEAGVFDSINGLKSNVFNQPTLNSFLQKSKNVWLGVRECLIGILKQNPTNTILKSSKELQNASFHDISKVKMLLPVDIGNYTDFYASREHATNVGTMFRGAANALNSNWLQLPVGYHGRASTVFCSGTPIRRPCGQIQKDPTIPVSIHGPCEKLDFELEVAAIVGGKSNLNPMSIDEAKDRIFGYVLMNDWSARDIQKWEYVPLGPFTSKNFATSISPWIVMTAALEGFIGEGNAEGNSFSFAAATSAIEQTSPIPLPYLRDPNYSSYDVKLSVFISPSPTTNNLQNESVSTAICNTNFRNMYWNAAQQLAHHSVTGCIMKAGDLLGSGTISGPTPDSFGSMLELSSNGQIDVSIGNSQTRRFLKDGDTVFIRGYCENKDNGIRIGFGECIGTVLPPHTTVASRNDDSDSRFVNFVLYGYWRSSCTWRVRTALVAKGIDFRTIPIDLERNEHKSKEYVEICKLGQVPLLKWTDQQTGVSNHLSQSSAIISFLDDCFPDRRSLIPKLPVAKACALEIIEVINAGIQPQQNIYFLKDVVDRTMGNNELILDVARSKIEIGLRVVDELVKKYRDANSTAGGPFVLGTFSPTIVDVYLVPQLYNARRMGVLMDNFRFLVDVETKCLEHQWFIASHPDNQPGAPSNIVAPN
jgi:fumarylacetoacetase